MKLTSLLIPVLILTAAGVFFFSGCDDEDRSISSTAVTPAVVSVYPPDGATDVPPGANMHIRFSGPMDTASVRQTFHFTGGEPMHRWLDSLEHHVDGGMGGMMGGQMMNMEHMMNWMDSIAWHGDFQWNNAHDSCTFIPDSALSPGTGYMMFFYGEIQGTDGRVRRCQDMPVDSVLYRFQTAP